MITACRSPVLILEGLGDRDAVPRLMREIYQSREVFDFELRSRSKLNVDVKKLSRDGELERYINYAARDEGDSVLMVLDCEDVLPDDVFRNFVPRIRELNLKKKAGVVLLRAEFETLFLYCLPRLAQRFPEYDWIQERLVIDGDLEAIRDAKGRLSQAMKTKAYKATRDQAKFITALDYLVLRERSRSFVQLEEALMWLAGLSGDQTKTVFPDI